MGFGIKLPKIKIGGDVGKALGAVTAPIRNTVKAVESVGRGDLQGAAGNIAYATTGSNSVAIASNASSTVNSALRTDAANTLTLGFSKDITESASKANSASYGRNIDAADWSLMGRTAVRSAVVVGAVAAAPMIGSSVASMSAPSATTVSNTLAGAGLLQKAATNPNGALAGLAESYAPGSGDIVAGLLPGNQSRTPAMTGGSAIAPTQTNFSKSNTGTYLVIGSLLFLGLAVAYKLRKGI